MVCNLEEQLKPYEKWVILAQEILLFKRPIIYAALLFIIWSLFAFAYSVEAGFFASLSLLACAVYMTVVIYAYVGSKLDKFLFSELPKDDPTASNHVRSLKELNDLIGKYIPETCTIKQAGELSQKGSIIAIFVSIFIAVFFKFVPPFWFNFVVVSLVLILPGVLAIPQVLHILFKTPLPTGTPAKPQTETPAPKAEEPKEEIPKAEEPKAEEAEPTQQEGKVE